MSTLIASALIAASQLPTRQPEELGRVEWLRNFEAATTESKRVDRPMLLLFQEVPG